MITDEQGEVTAPMGNATLYTISTGLAAISFDPILETGGSLAARSPVTIEAQRLINVADQPCRIMVGGVPNVYFSSTNVTDQLLTVPLSYDYLNRMYSVTGEAAPAQAFAPGTSGFSVPEAYFTSGRNITGVWRFLGQSVTVTPNLQVCSDRGEPGDCDPLDSALLQTPMDYTRATILRLTNQALAAARSGKWREKSGKFSVPFLSRGAQALAYMDRLLKNAKGDLYTCQAVPKSCSVVRVPKSELAKAFAGVFVGRVPRGLEHISARAKQENRAFARVLRNLPDRVVRCR